MRLTIVIATAALVVGCHSPPDKAVTSSPENAVTAAPAIAQSQTTCIHNGGCIKEEVATTPSPWWFEVADFSPDNHDDYATTVSEEVNVSSVKVDDASGNRTLLARARLEELDRQHFRRTGDAIMQEKVEIDCKQKRWRVLAFTSGSSEDFAKGREGPTLPASSTEWEPLSSAFVYKALQATPIANAVC